MKVLFSKRAEKQIGELNFFIQQKIYNVLKKFELGERVDIQKMKGKNDEFRIRVGGFRILMQKIPEGFLVTELGKRENIYFFEF